jgi:hypothetical protein
MGVGIRTRLTGGTGSERGELTDDDVQSALGRLSAYDAQPPNTERRRPVGSPPPLRRRFGLWQR